MLNTIQKNTLLMLVTAVAIVTMCFIAPIAQNPNYHCFADARKYCNIPNFFNVLSNIPFLMFGLVGLCYLQKHKPNILWLNYVTFFVGVFLTGLGSIYYHVNPNNQTLVWDRIPMTISFMAFFSVILSKFVCEKTGKQILFPFVLLGIISVLYWSVTEKKGYGDLRFYILIQFLPIILTIIILTIYNNKQITKKYFWLILAVYALAKVFETFDVTIYKFGYALSGHSIKHLFAALGTFIFLLTLTPPIKNN
jgi:Ceramidase